MTASSPTIGIASEVVDRGPDAPAPPRRSAERDRLRGAFEASSAILMLLDWQGRVLDANRAAERASGRSRRDLVGLAFSILFWKEGDQRARIERALAGARNGDTFLHHVGAITTSGATTLQLALSADYDRRMIFAEARELPHAIPTEERLRESESRYAAIFENSAEGIALIGVGSDGRFRYETVNPAHERATGLSLAEFAGRTPHDIFPAPFADDLVARFRRCLESGAGLAYQDSFPYPSGQRLMQVRLTPLQDASGRIARIVAHVRDITEGARTEAALHQAQKMEAVGQLTGGIAHDFNNLLTVIIGNLDMLFNRVREDGALRRMVQAATRAAIRGEKLTQQLLAFSRKQRLRPETVDLNQLVDGMAELLRRTLGETISVEIRTAGNLATCRADPTQVETALLNLALNARDAMRGGGKLTVSTANRTVGDADGADSAFVELAVADTGTGMSAEVIARAFEPFFTTKEIGKGTGLGLSMVYGFAKQSGGQVEIESELGRGTIVRLLLPRGTVADEAVRVDFDPPPRAMPGKTVLVVEDHDDVRTLAIDLLQEMGYRVIAAEDGPRALQVLRSDHTVDLLFADIMMPGGLSGRALAEEACRLRPGLPVLLATGHADPLSRPLSPGEREFELIAKPYSHLELDARIRRLLAGATSPN